MQQRKLRILTEGAILMALAELLSLLPLYKMPWGGSVDLGMLPILVFCTRHGLGAGLLVSFAHGFLQMLLGGGFAIGWQSILGDYLLAYAVLGFAGIFRGKLLPASITGCTLRFLVHYVVGATLWAEYMPESFFGLPMASPWVYSALYNGAFMAVDLVVILLVSSVLLKTPVRKYLLGADLIQS